MSYIDMNEFPKFLEIVEKHDYPKPVDNIVGKTVDYVIDDSDIQIIVFTDNTFYFMWAGDRIKIEHDFEDIYIEQGTHILTLLNEKYPLAKKEWDEYKQELKRQDDELKREYRYQQYLKLKAEFEGGK